DLEFFRAQGWHIDLLAHLRRGGRVLGICAGYQMLGTTLADPLHIEGRRASCAGLGLLDIATTMTAEKTLRTVSGIEQSTGARLEGYEMHIGISSGPDTQRPMLRLDDGASDGAMSSDGRVAGCHVHGLFAAAAFRAAYLASLGAHSTGMDHIQQVDRALDEIAAVLETSLDLDALLRLASAV
ncbi:MAG: cobyric acid synthase, partial [Steroidobacteraceae bacterium]